MDEVTFTRAEWARAAAPVQNPRVGPGQPATAPAACYLRSGHSLFTHREQRSSSPYRLINNDCSGGGC